ncbi:hypothetical protein ACWDFH_12475 [Streptomyces kronopolitis]
MRTTEAGFRIRVLDEEELTQDPYPECPVRVDVCGQFMEPVDGVETAVIQLRFDAAGLAELVAQGRSQQLAIAHRARQTAEAQTRAEIVAQGTEVARGLDPYLRTDIALLHRVVGGLHRLPDKTPAKDSSPDQGGP